MPLFTARDLHPRPYNRRMLAERPLPEDIADRIDAVAQAWSTDPDVAATYLVRLASQSPRRAAVYVDLAVVLREDLDKDARWRKRLALLGHACRRLETDAVDLIILEDAPAPLGHRVLKWGRLLHDGLPKRRAAVADHILRR